MRKITLFRILGYGMSILGCLLGWAFTLWALPQNNAGAIYNPNPSGYGITVGPWQKASWGNYETRTVVEKQFFYTVYGDQQRELKPDAKVMGDTTNLHSTLNVNNTAVVIILTIIIDIIFVSLVMSKMKRDANKAGRGFLVE